MNFSYFQMTKNNNKKIKTKNNSMISPVVDENV